MPANQPDLTEDRGRDNPALSKIIERNIRTIINLRVKASRARNLQDRAADAITGFSGNLGFVCLHVAWFSSWVLLNTGRLGVHPFDTFPYGLLTTVVSLAAIFLSALVLITQNRLTDENGAPRRPGPSHWIATEHELTRVLQMPDAIQEKLGIENHTASELADLEMETRPEDVLAEIARLQSAALTAPRRLTIGSHPSGHGSR